ncbi:MAG: glycosyltransferase family 4 protein [Bacteroidetes bacterium]|nr:glycosyltransferase family 4 protein [Bacteroidota bacterium]
MRKFFLISQVFYPDEVSTANLFTILCSWLANNNIEVEVWAAQPSYTHSKKQPRRLTYKGTEIKFLPSTRFHKSKIFGRILNILTFTVSTAFRLIFSKDKSPVFTHTNPPSLGILVSLICKLKKRKFIYVLLDIFPEGLIRLGKLSDGNPLVKVWKNMNIKTFRRSERIIVLGRDMGEYIESIYPEGREKIEYIPHWQDENLIHPISIGNNPFIKEHMLDGKFIIQYSGNMGLWNDMETIGKAASRYIEGVHYVFIGDGMRKPELQKTLSSAEHRNILFLPFQPVEKLGEVLTANHVSLVSLREGLEGMAVPSKIYGILAAGVPVIAMVPQQSEIAYIVREENCGYVVDPDDVDGLINAVMELKSDEQLRTKMGVNGRKAFEQKYTTKVIAGKYKSIILDMSF